MNRRAYQPTLADIQRYGTADAAELHWLCGHVTFDEWMRAGSQALRTQLKALRSTKSVRGLRPTKKKAKS